MCTFSVSDVSFWWDKGVTYGRCYHFFLQSRNQIQGSQKSPWAYSSSAMQEPSLLSSVEPSDTHDQILHNTLGVVPHSVNSPEPRLFGEGILQESHHIPFPQFDFWMEAALADFYDPSFSHIYFLFFLSGFCLHNYCQIFVFTWFVCLFQQENLKFTLPVM